MMSDMYHGAPINNIHGGDLLLIGILFIGLIVYLGCTFYCCNLYLPDEEPESPPYSQNSYKRSPERAELVERRSTDTRLTTTPDIIPRYEVVVTSINNIAKSTIYPGGPLRFENETQV